MLIKLKKTKTHYRKKFCKQFQNLTISDKRRIEEKLNDIFNGNAQPNIRKLTNYPAGEYRLKIGNYRLLFNYHKKTEEVIFTLCRHRKDLY